MARLTSVWTDRHLVVASAMSVAAPTGGLAVLASRPYDLLGMGAVLLTVVVAMSVDAFGGIVVGLSSAGAMIAVRQIRGDWARPDFELAMSLTLALIVLGWLTGLASARLRAPAGDGGQTLAVVPAHGSLGLLPAELVTGRLEEEIVRAGTHRRPLTVVLLSTTIADEGLLEASRNAVHRTVARLVESLVPETAVPFALAADEVGAILPETDAASAWELLGPVLDAAGRASFTDREQGERRSLVHCAEVHAGLAQLSPEHPDVPNLIAAVRRAAHSDRPPASPGSAPPLGTTPC